MSHPNPERDAGDDVHVSDLQRRVAELEAENQQLTESAETDARPGKKRWRSVVATVLIVLAGLLAPVSMLGTWAKTTLIDSDTFVANFSPVIRDPSVQAYLTDQVSAAIEQQIDVERVVGDAVNGLQSAVGDRRAAAAALALLEQPAIEGIRGVITRVTGQVVTSDAFAATWDQTLRTSHTQLIGALNGDPSTLATITDDGLGIRLGPIVERVRAELQARGFALASRIPAVERTIVLVPSAQLTDVQRYYLMAIGVSGWLPWVVIGLLAAGVLAANSRSAALLGAGVAVALGAALVLIVLAVAHALLPTAVPASVMPADVLNLLYATATTGLHDVAYGLLTLGAVIAVIAWFGGRSRTAGRVRAGWAQATASMRRTRDGYGLDTGRFGHWLYTARVWVRVGVAAIAVLVLWANRPLTVFLIVFTVVIAALALLLATLLWRTEPVATSDVPQT